MTREQRVSRAMRKMLGAVLTISALGVVVGALGRSDFLRGFSTGLLVVLPWAIVLMVWRGYRQMDEFGQRRSLRAAGAAFVVVMLACGTYFPLQQSAHWPELPVWLLWVVGWGSWGLALALEALQDRRAGA